MPSSGASARSRVASPRRSSTASPAVNAQLLRQVGVLRSGFTSRVRMPTTAARFSTCGSRCAFAERRRARHQLLVDARLVAGRRAHRDLMITMRSSSASFLFSCRNLWNSARLVCARIGLVDVNQRETRDLDVFLLRQGQQQVQELALHLENFDHLEHAAAGGIHRSRP